MENKYEGRYEDAYQEEIDALLSKVAALEAELAVARIGNLIAYGTSHPEMYKDAYHLQLEAELRLMKDCAAEYDSKFEQLEAELAAARVDAERYRWLRDKCNSEAFLSALYFKYEDDFDAAIDAARSRHSNEGGGV